MCWSAPAPIAPTIARADAPHNLPLMEPLITCPLLSAHRGDTDEVWRMDRLMRVWIAACRSAERGGRLVKLIKAVVALYDHKGNLTVTFADLRSAGHGMHDLRAGWHAVDEFTPIRMKVLHLKKPRTSRALASDRRKKNR